MRAPLFILGMITTTALSTGVLGDLTGGLFGPLPAAAQENPFSQVISVNGQGITAFEIDQRARLITLLGSSPDARKQAEEDLIEDRLRRHAAKAAGITVSREAVAQGMTDFAGRANMNSDEFLAAIAGAGVEPQTFRDFVEAGVAWRETVRAKYAGEIRISESELDRAMSPTSERGAGTRVLMQEFIIPAPPGNEAEARAIAERVSRTTNEADFGALARQYSATGTRGAGGRLPWTDLSQIPPALRSILLALEPGKTSDPLTIPNAIAVFRLRAIDEEGSRDAGEQVVDYAEYLIPPISTEAGQAERNRVAVGADTCDDLYGLNKGQDAARLTRETLPLPQVPTDVALQLAHLDPGEVSTAISRGANTVLLMLCSRNRPETEETPSRDAVRERLVNARVGQLADADIAELKANAVIKR